MLYFRFPLQPQGKPHETNLTATYDATSLGPGVSSPAGEIPAAMPRT
jgi:hypothetical protein